MVVFFELKSFKIFIQNWRQVLFHWRQFLPNSASHPNRHTCSGVRSVVRVEELLLLGYTTHRGETFLVSVADGGGSAVATTTNGGAIATRGCGSRPAAATSSHDPVL